MNSTFIHGFASTAAFTYIGWNLAAQAISTTSADSITFL